MSEVRPILIPRENIADDTVIISSWLKKTGDWIRRHDELLEIETSKAVFTLEADQDGYLEILHQAEEQVAVGETIALIHTAPFNDKASSKKSPVDNRTVSNNIEITLQSKQISTGISFSKKALELLKKHGLSPEIFKERSFVKESDVQVYLTSHQQSSVVTKKVAVSTEPNPYRVTGFIGEIFRASKKRKMNLFVFALNYIFRDYLLNLLTRLAPIGLIIIIHKLRGVKIGKGCFIDSSAVLETAYPEDITLGHDVRITARCVVMTHIKAPNYLQDMGLIPVLNKPVVFEDHCFIGVNSVIMPGVRVGRASVVNSGSVVLNDVPPYCVVAGNPAKVVKKFPKPAIEQT